MNQGYYAYVDEEKEEASPPQNGMNSQTSFAGNTKFYKNL